MTDTTVPIYLDLEDIHLILTYLSVEEADIMHWEGMQRLIRRFEALEHEAFKQEREAKNRQSSSS